MLEGVLYKDEKAFAEMLFKNWNSIAFYEKWRIDAVYTTKLFKKILFKNFSV